MQFFRCEAIEFLNEIRNNNSKEWFTANRARYEELILEPSRHFVQEMGEKLLILEPYINAVPKVNGSLFRIYRDTRLSKDKTPIKSRIGIIFWRGSGKRLQSANFYLHFSPDELLVATGIRGFSKDTLDGYREYIKNKERTKELKSIIADLKEKGFSFPKPKYKRYPRGFEKENHYANLPLYASMYAYKRFNPETICHEDLNSFLFKIWQESLPLFEWIYQMTLTVKVRDPKAKALSLG